MKSNKVFKMRSLMIFVLLFNFASNSAHAPFRIISMPVSGTHLLERAVSLLLTPDGSWKSPRGVHVPGSSGEIEASRNSGHKILFNLRDPRDRVVSYAFKIKKIGSIKNAELRDMSIEQISLDVLTKYGTMTHKYITNGSYYQKMGDFSEYYREYLPWLEYPQLLVVSFENLVGPNAGGSLERQIAEIKKIAEFIEVPISDNKAQEIASKLYGGTPSFRDPKIGIWKDYFTDEHKDAFKKTMMAQFLIDYGYAEDMNW